MKTRDMWLRRKCLSHFWTVPCSAVGQQWRPNHRVAAGETAWADIVASIELRWKEAVAFYVVVRDWVVPCLPSAVAAVAAVRQRSDEPAAVAYLAVSTGLLAPSVVGSDYFAVCEEDYAEAEDTEVVVAGWEEQAAAAVAAASLSLFPCPVFRYLPVVFESRVEGCCHQVFVQSNSLLPLAVPRPHLQNRCKRRNDRRQLFSV